MSSRRPQLPLRLGRLAPLAAAVLLAGCDQVRIGSPRSLWLLWLAPALAVFFAYSFASRARLLRRFATPAMLARLTSGVSRPRQLVKAALVVLAVLATALALAELKYGFTWEEVQRRGVDIVIALDVSDSMLVEDAESGGRLSRLERAKREIADLLRLVEGDRIGLVAFAGSAFLECPLTLDYGAAQLFLSAIDTDLIPVKGTALGEAIRTAVAAFEGGTHDSRAIILITDGEDHVGDALDAAEQAKLAGVRIFAIGIGRDEGAPIPAAGGGFRRDRRGEIILSRLDEATLQRIALTTGGRYVRSVTGDVDLEQIYAQGIKATLVDRELESQRRQRWKDRFQWLLAVALVALMLEPLVGERRRRAESAAAGLRAGTAAGAAVLAAALALAGAVPAGAGQTGEPPPAEQAAPAVSGGDLDDPWNAYQAGAYDRALQGFIERQVENPEEPVLALAVGSSRYQLNDFAAADKEFARAALAADPGTRQRALYNLGNSAYRQGRLEEAVELYKAALEVDPDDEDAKFNLEFVREEIRRRLEQARQREQQQQGQQDGQNQQETEGDGGQQPQDQEGQEQEPQDGQQQGEQDTERQQQPGGADSDGDGLPDATERQGANPTDPADPDSDGDSLPDGAEDSNRNGRVDAGETDPNRADSDGDGVPDAADPDTPAGTVAAAQAEGDPGGLTPEEAERYLQALEDGRPQQRRPGDRRATRPRKDW